MSNTEDSNGAGIFEKIIAREVPASIIYEDDATISFLDIRPVNKGHALVVPKKKSRNIFDADPEDMARMMTVAQKVAKALKEELNADGVNVIMNNEKAGGQDVFHSHIHVIPRFEGDGVLKHAEHTSYDEGEMEEIAEKLKVAIA